MQPAKQPVKRYKKATESGKAVRKIIRRYKIAHFFLEQAAKIWAGRAILKASAALDKRIINVVLGKPMLAEKMAAVHKDPELKEGLLGYGRLPFINPSETSQYFKGTTDKLNFKQFRIFSRDEIENFRVLMNEKGEPSQHKSEVKEAFGRILSEKAGIMQLAAIEPELTQIVFRELFSLNGINEKSRNDAIKLVKALHKLPQNGMVEIELIDHRKKATVATVSFTRIAGARWRFRKIIKGNKVNYLYGV